MKTKLNNEAIARLLEIAANQDLYVTSTFDRWNNDPFYIVESWEDVRSLRSIAREELTPDDLLEGEDWEEFSAHLAQDGKYDDLDYILGEWSFADSYTTCSHCNGALCIENNMYYEWWHNEHTGDITCNKCTCEGFGEEYLEYCAARLESHGEIAHHSFANPREFGFVRLNKWEDEEEEIDGADHTELPYQIEYASYDELRMLGKAARLIDDGIQLVAQFHPIYSSTYVYWARFEPNSDWSGEENEDILNYAIGRVFAKFNALRRSSTILTASQRAVGITR